MTTCNPPWRAISAPWDHPPTIDQTAAHYRGQRIAAVIFPVDAERETGYRRYASEEVAEACARHTDILIPFVAADFPQMQIIAAHPSFPWQDEALAVATHKPNVWIDLSGWRPKYFPPILIQYANTLLKDRVLFGSDWPMIAPEGWLAEFNPLPIRDAVRPGILKHNAARLLGLKEH